MAEFIYTTEATMRGPWLVDADKLEALDKVLDEEWERLAKRNQESIENVVAKTMDENDEIWEARAEKRELSPRELQNIRNETEKTIRGSYGYKESRKITIFYEREEGPK